MKSFKKKARKGFTLIELVVVIAVIAILGGVSVATYVVVMKNANLSNDQQTIKMMNDTLTQHQYSDGGKNSKVSDAVSDLYADGFDLSSKNAYSSGYHYVYNQSQDQMVLVDGSWSAVYPEKSSVGSDTWAFYKGSGEDISASVNNYFVFNDVSATNLTMFPGAAVIDLNGYMCTADTYAGNIKIQNGFCYEILKNNATNCTIIDAKKTGTLNGTTYSFGGGSVEKTDLPKELIIDGLYMNGGADASKAPNMVNAYLDYNYSLPAGTDYSAYDITIKNCTFTNGSSGGIFGGKAIYNKITYENNTFVGSFKWTIATNNVKNVVINNNKFINCQRGINIDSTNDQLKTVTITNNEMRLYNESKSNAFQLAASSTYLSSIESISISNNKIDTGNAALTLHSSLTKEELPGSSSALLADIKSRVTLDVLKSKMKFSNNSFVNLASSTLVIADPDLASDYTINEDDAAVVAYFNELANGMSAYIK